MTKPEKDTCDTCKFAKDGYCRRFPPIANPVVLPGSPGKLVTYFPDLPSDKAGCGEWAKGKAA